MKELEKLEELKKLTMQLVASKKKFLKLSARRSSMSHTDNTPKSIENAEANLNWHAMSHDKLFRELHAVSVDCGLSLPKDDYSEIEYNPSAWHKYNYTPRLPLCRQ
jgi:hypothetical protein